MFLSYDTVGLKLVNNFVKAVRPVATNGRLEMIKIRNSSTQMLIEGNELRGYEVTEPVGIESGNGGTLFASNNLVRNNRIYAHLISDGTGKGITFYVVAGGHSAVGNVVYVDNGATIWADQFGTDATAINNTLVSPTGGGIYWGAGSTYTDVNNRKLTRAAPDPMTVDPDGTMFHLTTSDTSAIDQGTITSVQCPAPNTDDVPMTVYPYTDCRPWTGSAPDVGAFEY
jgi:hypothetical protein